MGSIRKHYVDPLIRQEGCRSTRNLRRFLGVSKRINDKTWDHVPKKGFQPRQALCHQYAPADDRTTAAHNQAMKVFTLRRECRVYVRAVADHAKSVLGFHARPDFLRCSG
jgi:hypothetical protein